MLEKIQFNNNFFEFSFFVRNKNIKQMHPFFAIKEKITIFFTFRLQLNR